MHLLVREPKFNQGFPDCQKAYNNPMLLLELPLELIKIDVRFVLHKGKEKLGKLQLSAITSKEINENAPQFPVMN